MNKCTDIDSYPVKASYEIADVAIPQGVKGDIGLVIKGYFNAPQDGVYSFVLLSDDGSVLKVDDAVVVDNDGPHSPQELSGQRALAKGLHPIEIRYFDNNGGTLKLEVLDPSGKVMPYTEGIYAYE